MYGDTGKALQLYSEFVKENPDAYPEGYNYAYTLYLVRQYAGAEAQFRRVLTLKDDAKAHHYLGETLMHEQKLTEAQAELQKAIALDATEDGAHAALGLADEFLGQKDEAVRAYQAELASHPQNQAAAQRLAALTAK
jgi:tetratricopeptide (TPR) repeat protein